jgi:hypothetical protein
MNSDLEERYESELESYEQFEEPSGETIEEFEEPSGETIEEFEEPSGETIEEFEEPSGETNEGPFKLEMEGDVGTTMETDSSVNYFAQRFLELQEKQFESSESRNAAVDGLLNEVEKQFFLGNLTGGVVTGLLKKLIGGAIPGNPLKIIKGAMALVRLAAKEPLRGALLNVITLHPALAPARPLLKLLGISETSENAGNSLERWKEFTQLGQKMYENIINNMNKAAASDPVAANQLASQAFTKAASQIRSQTAARGYGKRKRRRVIYLGPGEYVVVRGRRRF